MYITVSKNILPIIFRYLIPISSAGDKQQEMFSYVWFRLTTATNVCPNTSSYLITFQPNLFGDKVGGLIAVKWFKGGTIIGDALPFN